MIKIEYKSQFGNNRYFPICGKAKRLVQFANQKTFTREQIDALSHEFTFELVTPENHNFGLEQSIASLIEQVSAKRESCSFASIDYTSKSTGERARHMLLLKYDLTALYEKDLATMTAKRQELVESGTDSLTLQAANEIIASLDDSLVNGIGNNQDYTCKGVYNQVGEQTSQKIDSPTEFYLLAKVESKKILKEGEYKPDRRKPLTIAKDEFRKDLRTSKIRRFKLSEEFFNEFRGNRSILAFSDRIEELT